MNTVEIIAKKRDGLALSHDELAHIVRGSVDHSIPDYQLSAFLMAGRIRGFDLQETVDLTLLMARSGETMDLSLLSGIKADKHSTGGVGDKTSLVVMPIIAEAGLVGAKMSGRGLGHTGGTLDKLEAIPGLRIQLSKEEFIRQLREVGLAIVSQSANLAPADKTLYSLRDVTATVDSLPLIAASIMSKKLSMAADVLVLDVKYGSGAMLPKLNDARSLARLMVDIATAAGIKTTAVLSSMEQPLGYAIGNALEIKEVIETLQGNGPADLRQLCLTIAGEQLYLAGLCASPEVGFARAEDILNSGKAYGRFCAMVRAQGGSNDFSALPQAAIVQPYRARESGYLASFDTADLGRAAAVLGAGRQKKSDTLDYGAGFVLLHKVGDFVSAGDALLEMHGGSPELIAAAEARLDTCIHISANPPQPQPLIAELLRGADSAAARAKMTPRG